MRSARLVAVTTTKRHIDKQQPPERIETVMIITETLSASVRTGTWRGRAADKKVHIHSNNKTGPLNERKRSDNDDNSSDQSRNVRILTATTASHRTHAVTETFCTGHKPHCCSEQNSCDSSSFPNYGTYFCMSGFS